MRILQRGCPRVFQLPTSEDDKFVTMTGGVTYQGVESADGGTIFKDMVFWVAQRVPMRSTILDHIKVRARIHKGVITYFAF